MGLSKFDNGITIEKRNNNKVVVTVKKYEGDILPNVITSEEFDNITMAYSTNQYNYYLVSRDGKFNVLYMSTEYPHRFGLCMKKWYDKIYGGIFDTESYVRSGYFIVRKKGREAIVTIIEGTLKEDPVPYFVSEYFTKISTEGVVSGQSIFCIVSNKNGEDCVFAVIQGEMVRISDWYSKINRSGAITGNGIYISVESNGHTILLDITSVLV